MLMLQLDGEKFSLLSELRQKLQNTEARKGMFGVRLQRGKRHDSIGAVNCEIIFIVSLIPGNVHKHDPLSVNSCCYSLCTQRERLCLNSRFDLSPQ